MEEDNVEECKEFLDSPAGRLVVIDSLSALQPTAAGFEEWNEAAYNLLQSLRSRTPSWSLVVVVNQVRAKRTTNPKRPVGYGTESQARWVWDLFDVRLEISRENVKDDDYNMIVNILANPLAQPSVWVELPAQKGYGVALSLAFFDTAVRLGIIEARGTHFYLGEDYLGQGSKEASKHLHNNARLRWIVEKALRAT